ncbi:bacterial extracellular solute-binding protein, family 3 [Gonapodya prolifera JEL478]|uniref:Bacterial extracellular solute-binding protein, family 3 n=1 Tax=Gonapodya prolifera (strain JEL478) TaxID=1344416 RepID=A0A139ARC4_GONPJ|nr:bacterial extracellular solute-binding protein, family 3 [Gonapodya prolifera JEL478]|eukprot:KXS19301.1 bacterial extracellular solute-binding protein, family 3 [Gonapodya prolifera JEL478]
MVKITGLWALALLASLPFGFAHQTGGPSLINVTSLTSLLDAIVARDYLIVGTTGDYKPFTYLVTNVSALPADGNTTLNGSFIGADIDQALSLSKALNLSAMPRFVRTAWANITSDLTAGKFDIAMGGVSVTTTRAKKVLFSTAIQRVGKTACIRCEDSAKYTNLQSLNQTGVKIAVNPGGTNEAFDKANLQAATIVLVANNNAVYQAVLNGAADAMISDKIEVELQLRLHPGKLCIVNSEPFNFEELGYAVPRDFVWKHFVDTWVRTQIGSGGWNTTLDKWLGYGWPLV